MSIHGTTRRAFLKKAALGFGLPACAYAAIPSKATGAPVAEATEKKAQAKEGVAVCNPLLRTPLSLIIDDSCPVINMAYFWIDQQHTWRLKHRPDSKPSGWERHYDKLGSMPRTIPAAFAAEWGNWCGEQGIRGKFSMVPYPAGVGRIDQGFPDFPKRELDEWLRVTREIIWKNFDLTPEMLTHTHVVDLKTWKLTDAWEQGEWVDPPVELLTDYIAAAMQLLKNAGFACEGVTSPGVFGKRKEDAYAKAVLDAAQRVNDNRRPFYFLHLIGEGMPSVPLRHVEKDKGIAIASIVACAGDWFGATGWDESNSDLFITEDLKGGRVAAVLERELPCALVGHWPCFYANGQIGFKVLKEVKKRLDAYDPDRTKTIWMKNSEIGRYWMARELSELTVQQNEKPPQRRLEIATRFPAANFTVSLNLAAKRVQVGKRDLRPVQSRRDFRSGTFLVEGRKTFVAFDLGVGKTVVESSVE
jgi:hypothetical protein